MFHKNFKSQYFFLKTHFMDSQINKVHSSAIFCVFLSDWMRFWDTSISFSHKNLINGVDKLGYSLFPGDQISNKICIKLFIKTLKLEMVMSEIQ